MLFLIYVTNENGLQRQIQLSSSPSPVPNKKLPFFFF